MESNEISMCEASEFLGKEYIRLGHDITSYSPSGGCPTALGVNLFFNTAYNCLTDLISHYLSHVVPAVLSMGLTSR